MDNPSKVLIVMTVFATAAYIVRTIANAVMRVAAGRTAAGGELSSGGAAADARLARLEQAVDAIAVEIERISEGQRFTTKLLADRAQRPAALEPQHIDPPPA